MRYSPIHCTCALSPNYLFGWVATLIFVLLPLLGYAQEAEVHGTITDVDGIPLIGATVKIQSAVIGTVSDIDGEYEIEVPPGQIQLVYTYLGYRDLDTTITVGTRQRNIRLDVVMRAMTGEELPEIFVFGRRAARQSQALRLQQSSLNAQTIITSEVFNKYPDITMAETVSRMPGVSLIRGAGEGQIVQVRGLPEQFTAVALNGQRLPTIQAEADQEGTLDLIQSNLVEEVRVIKSRTADMDGDAIGGTVDFRIRQPERQFEVLAQGGVGQNFGFDGNPDQRTGVTQLTGVLNSEVADEKIYALVAGSYFAQGRGVQQRTLDYGGLPDIQDESVLTHSRPANINRQSERTGFVGAVELRPSIYNRLRISYTRSTNTQDITQRQLFGQTGNGFAGSGDYLRRTTDWTKDRRLELVALEVENNFPRTRLDYQLSFSQTQEGIGDRLSAIARKTVPASEIPTTDLLINLDPTDAIGVDPYALTATRQENISLNEDVAILSFNITRYLNKGKTSYLRGGVRYRSKDRIYGTFLPDGQPFDTQPLFASGDSPPVLERPVVDEVPDLEEEARRYSARQRINAAYLQYAANFTSRLSASAGVRLEQLEIRTEEPDMEEFGFEETDVLPSANITYRIRQDRQLRFSYYKAVARANYATYLAANPVALITLDEFSVGNQSVQTTQSDNLDLTFERYGRRDGLLTLSIYYKRLGDPTLRVSTTDYSGLIPTYQTRLVNTQNSNLVGFEAGFYQNLGFIGKATSWRYWNLNGTYNVNALSADSRIYDFDSFTIPQAPRQTANLSVVHNNPNKGLSVVLAMNFRDRIFDRVLDDRPVFKNSVFSLDLSADYEFYKDFSVYLRANNLTDHPFREYFGVPNDDRLRSEAYYGVWGVVGVRYQPR